MIALSNTDCIQFQWLGLVEYAEALKLQLDLSDKIRESHQHGLVLALHHHSVVTLGKRADLKVDLSMNCQIPTIEIDRGGQATLHSPGQMVIYPILNLKLLNLDVRSYVKLLERTTIEFLKQFGVNSFTTEQPGVFTNKGKIAFIGVRVDRGITRHGISININNDISLFQNIRSCGVLNPTFDLLSQYSPEVNPELVFKIWKDQFMRLLKAVYSQCLA